VPALEAPVIDTSFQALLELFQANYLPRMFAIIFAKITVA